MTPMSGSSVPETRRVHAAPAGPFESSYNRAFDEEQDKFLRQSFVAYGRERFWDL
jgi:hypothetical protein